MADDELAPLNQAMSDFCTQLTAMAGDINALEEAQADALKDDPSIRVALPKEAYRDLLKKRLGVSLDELLSWYQEEVVKTRAEVFRIAAGSGYRRNRSDDHEGSQRYSLPLCRSLQQRRGNVRSRELLSETYPRRCA